jgi:hypothetical protein
MNGIFVIIREALTIFSSLGGTLTQSLVWGRGVDINDMLAG